MADLAGSVSHSIKFLVSFRGRVVDFVADPSQPLYVRDVQKHLASATLDNESSFAATANIHPSDIKILYQGKVLSDSATNLYDVVVVPSSVTVSTKVIKRTVRLIATGRSSEEVHEANQRMKEEMNRTARGIRDDLTAQGQAQLLQRNKAGRMALSKHTTTSTSKVGDKKYGFHSIRTLPMLPEEGIARKILSDLANDPGIIACMTKHGWNVGCLAELYPEGKVGESDVCTMGLNKSKGQEILLRLRTDDLKGFRKILSIRKVLFHELAHNVHSEHDGQFFTLMRQIEKECNEMNWTMTSGRTLDSSREPPRSEDSFDGSEEPKFHGGSYRLGGNVCQSTENPTPRLSRDLLARAALMRMTQSENNAIIDKDGKACECNHLTKTQNQGNGKGDKYTGSSMK